MSQRFGFAQARKWIPLNLANQPDYSERLGTILGDPPSQVFEDRRINFERCHNPSFVMTVSSPTPSCPWAASNRRSFIFSDFSRSAVSRSDAISRQSSMGTSTAVGSPASLETI